MIGYEVDRGLLLRLMTYMRPSGGRTERKFCEIYLEPICGLPDDSGNYTLVLGDRPNVCFTSHYDTVHYSDGYQKVYMDGDFAKSDSDCLGADCTTGIWLMLGMIKAGVEGVYVFHAAEELGCIGSQALVYDYPSWLVEIDFVISFDRYGTDSIITEQMGGKTASKQFAKDLSKLLDLPQLKPDPTGVYTDSNSYASTVSECTNVSVGYYSQHTSKEKQDIPYAEMLLERLCKARWSTLASYRDPTLLEPSYRGSMSNYSYDPDEGEVADLVDLMSERPDQVAELLLSYGVDCDMLIRDLGLDEYTPDYNYGGAYEDSQIPF